VQSHKCSRLFYLEVSGFDNDTITELDMDVATPMISLHALTDIRMEDTMQLLVRLNRSYLTTLLDTGSTHNFADCGTPSIEFGASDGLHVTVANGDKITCCGLSCSIDIMIVTDGFSAGAYGIPLNTFDIILSIQVLRDIGTHPLGP